jgi:uncharacterized protein
VKIRRAVLWSVAWGVGIGAALCVTAGVILCEASIRVPKRAIPATSFEGTSRSAVQITAKDGAVLRAWLFTPQNRNGNAVIVLHGISDSRSGAMGLARLFVENRYTVLAPDSRGHAESGGELVTYGLREADDIHRWVDWLMASEHPRNVFGMGESLGAAVLLQSLAVEPRFSAVVAECPFANFGRVAEDRVAQRIPLAPGLAQVLARPVVWSAFLYARARYGLDFWQASPEKAVANISTPVLLIHGLEDTNIYPQHSQTLAARNPRFITLWLAPGARHTAAFGAAPQEFPRRVLGWFSSHERAPDFR